MKKNITKKVKQELKEIIDIKGYWSEDIKTFVSNFDHITRRKLLQIADVYEKYGYMD
jgi:transcription antitermination factor NusA-like protein